MLRCRLCPLSVSFSLSPSLTLCRRTPAGVGSATGRFPVGRAAGPEPAAPPVGGGRAELPLGGRSVCVAHALRHQGRPQPSAGVPGQAGRHGGVSLTTVPEPRKQTRGPNLHGGTKRPGHHRPLQSASCTQPTNRSRHRPAVWIRAPVGDARFRHHGLASALGMHL